MYTVIIADDEYELRQSLHECIDWEAIGFQIIGEAANGIEALELVEMLEPDLLLTDIKMPFISGIELARQVNRIRPAIHIAFLSGYDDFAYAKEAIQYNIISYMLKPLSAEELTQELLKVKEKMDERFARMFSLETQMWQEERAEISKFSFLLTLCMNEEQDIYNEEEKEKEFEVMAENSGLGRMNDRSKNFFLFVTRFLDSDKRNKTKMEHQNFVNTIASKYVNCVTVYINGKIITIVAGTLRNLNKYEEIFTKEIIQVAKKILNMDGVIGVSKKFNQLLNTRSAYLDAMTAWEYAKEDINNICFLFDVDKHEKESYSAEYIRDITFELERRLKMGQDLEGFLKTVIDKERRNNNSFLMLQIVTTIYGVASNLDDEEGKQELMDKFLISDKINLNYSYEDLINLAVGTSNIIVGQRRHNSEIICSEFVDIIDREYMNEELSLSSISERLHVSTGYLSTVVKRIQGETFVNLLTAKRMEAAKDYLFLTSKKIMEIAEDCGYSDYHYFSYCFKKFYGMSPNKMRERYTI